MSDTSKNNDGNTIGLVITSGVVSTALGGMGVYAVEHAGNELAHLPQKPPIAVAEDPVSAERRQSAERLSNAGIVMVAAGGLGLLATGASAGYAIRGRREAKRTLSDPRLAPLVPNDKDLKATLLPENNELSGWLERVNAARTEQGTSGGMAIGDTAQTRVRRPQQQGRRPDAPGDAAAQSQQQQQ